MVQSVVTGRALRPAAADAERRPHSAERGPVRCGAAVCGSLLALLLAAPVALAQQIPPGALAQLNDVLANRIETLVILGGESGAAGGPYVFGGGSAVEVGVIKVGGEGVIGERRPLGLGGIGWKWIVGGGIGYVSADNSFERSHLAGSSVKYGTLGLGLTGGARIYLTEIISIAPKLGFMYGRTSNEFTPGNPLAARLAALTSGFLVDWELNTWTVTPQIDVKLDWQASGINFEFTSDVHYFYTRSFGGSEPFVRIDGGSMTWSNKIDVDVPLSYRVLGRPLRVGGFFNRVELFGDINEAMRNGHINEANARVVLDVADVIWKTRWIGLGGGYFWGGNFDGWLLGVDVRMAF